MIAEAALCLALNVYHEARGEPLDGQLAVALVTRNRAVQKDEGICWTVFKHRQFSWTTVPTNMRTLPTESDVHWRTAQQVAAQVLYGQYDFTCGATHYHTRTSRPYWAPGMTRVGQWGEHVFYRERGKRSTCAR